jgi:CHAT domain-containing protein
VKAFGYGNHSEQKNSLSDLPGSISEIQAIRERFQGDDNSFYTDQLASESTFRQQAGNCDILHLAVHGLADTLNTLESHLVFRSDADTVEDGRLYAHELYDLDIKNIDLVVLSGCESGLGKRQPGEGVMSIARGFAYAGCPTIVMSLWRIQDQSSAIVVSHFYDNLSAGMKIDKALTSAKEQYLSEANELSSHPSNWAALIQLGDNRALKIDHDFRWWLYLAAGLAGIFLFYVIRRYLHAKSQRN